MKPCSFAACGASLLAALAAACAAPGPEDPPAGPPATPSAVILAEGDGRVAAADHRVVLGGDSQILEQMLEAGAFNDCLSDDEAAAFLDLARSVSATGSDGLSRVEKGGANDAGVVAPARLAASDVPVTGPRRLANRDGRDLRPGRPTPVAARGPRGRRRRRYQLRPGTGTSIGTRERYRT